MAKSRAKLKGRREGGSFAAFPHACAEHPNYLGLSGSAVKLLHDMHHRYNGKNNGDLSVAMTIMQPRGWKSPMTLAAARDELEDRGWIVRTTWATRKSPVLYALTFLAIDDCNGKLDVKASQVALGYWKLGKNPEPDKFPKKVELLGLNERKNKKKSVIQKLEQGDTETVSGSYRNCICDQPSATETVSVSPLLPNPQIQNLYTSIDIPGASANADASAVAVDVASAAESSASPRAAKPKKPSRNLSATHGKPKAA
ncbi:hypothetical protein [Hydrocarboniphaga effusa]|uniref:hypothetical protein n=1 Tax=Hydrocarboniphaga effusa TaxID=243629 RepID=UPI003BAA9C83